MNNARHEKIKTALKSGLSVRAVSRSLSVSTKPVQEVRAQHPDLFAPRPPKKEKEFRAPRVAQVAIFGRIPSEIYARFVDEVKKRGGTISDLVRDIFVDRYENYNQSNKYEPQSGCIHDQADILKNCNSNHDRDGFVCNRCGIVFDGDGEA